MPTEGDQSPQARALAKWGLQAQLGKLVEELVEAADAAIKLMQGRVASTALMEEIIGVESVVQSVRGLLGQDWEWELLRADQEEKLLRHLEAA